MNFEICSIPRGQLNNVILSTMFEGDKYGYEIIEDILIRSNNKIEIKQPSLYSALKRLESSKMLTSYWKNSELGGDRHYYSITDLGKKTIVAWLMKYVKNNKLIDDSCEALTADEIKTETFIKENAKIENNEENASVIVQKEIKTSSIDENKSLKENYQENDVQLDLFDKIKVESVAKESKIQKASKIAEENEKNKIIQLKQYSEIDRKNEYLKLRKECKSFIKSSQKNEIEHSFTEKTVNQTASQNIFNANEEQNNLLQKNKECRDGVFITERIGKEKQKQEIEEKTQEKIEDYSNKVDGIFLSKDEVIEETPAVKKIEPAILNIENQTISKFNEFKFTEKTKNCNNFETNVKQEEEKPFERKCTFASYQGLATYLSHLGIKFKEFKK